MKWYTKDQIIAFHTMLIKVTGGSDGIRDEGMLESAIASPLQSFGGVDLYPTIIEKAARLAFCIVLDHPFFDGNKRIGALSLFSTLELNGIKAEINDNDAVEIFLRLAAGTLAYEELLSWVKSICEHQKAL